MSDAARDVEGVQLEINLERRCESLELRQQLAFEPAAPQPGCSAVSTTRAVGRLPRLARYGASLFTSPSRLFVSPACSRPWTCAAVRTPIPHSLMKPAAAD